MPAALRPKGKAKKIAFSILGIPPALAFKQTKKQRETDDSLVASETSLVR